MQVHRWTSASSSLSLLTTPRSRSLPVDAPLRCRQSVCSRRIHLSTRQRATPLSHPTFPGPPPEAPQAAVDTAQDRAARRRQQAELLRQGQEARATHPSKKTAVLSKRFWKNVSVKETEQGLQVMLDTRPVRTANRQILVIPSSRKSLATLIALEWDQLVTAQQALKHHYIPLTSLISRALDIEAADKASDSSIRDTLIKMLLRYLSTDTLLCWVPEENIHDPEENKEKRLLQRQKEVAEPIIAYLKTHIFPGIELEPILDANSILPRSQPQLTQEVIRGWIHGLPAFELAALERAVLATKSLLVAVRLLVEWSKEFAHLQKQEGDLHRFGIDEASEAASLEVMHQIQQWNEVEDTHDVEREDLRRQLGSVVLLVS